MAEAGLGEKAGRRYAVTVPTRQPIAWQASRAMAWGAVADLGHVRRDPRTGRWYIDLRPHARVYTYRAPWGAEEPFRTERDAERALESIREWCADGFTVAAAIERIRPREGSLVSTLAQEWLREKRDEVAAGRRVARSIHELELSVRREWGRWAGAAVHDVTSASLRRWATDLGRRGLAPATVRGELARFRAFLVWVYAQDRLARIPAFPTVSLPDRVRPTLTTEQQEAVLAEIEERLRGAFLAAVELALRPQETRAMLAADVGPEEVRVRRAAKGRSYQAPVDGTKTGTHRVLPTPERLAAWAERWIAAEDRVAGRVAFPSPKGRMWSDAELRREWRRASAAAQVPYVPVRDATRRSTAQEWRRRGDLPVSTIRDAMGHTQERTTRIYLGQAAGELVGILSARRKREPKT